MSFNIVSLIGQETVYECPKCNDKQNAYEWNIATADDVGDAIMPIHLTDDADYCYTCPSCSDVSSIHEIPIVLGV